jgi:putative membrane protein
MVKIDMNMIINGFIAAIPFIILHDDGWNMMDWDHHMMDWWGVPFLGYWSIGILIGVVLIIIYFIIHNEKKEEGDIMFDAQKTLDNRYAKGEMTREEYIQAKEDLKNFKPK